MKESITADSLNQLTLSYTMDYHDERDKLLHLVYAEQAFRFISDLKAYLRACNKGWEDIPEEHFETFEKIHTRVYEILDDWDLLGEVSDY